MVADGGSKLECVETVSAVARAIIRTEGDEQFVILPDAFRFAGSEVSIRRENGCVILEAAAPSPPPRTDDEWSHFWAEIDALRGGSQVALAADEDDTEVDPQL